MPSRDVNAATRLAEASWRRDNVLSWIKILHMYLLKGNHILAETGEIGDKY